MAERNAKPLTFREKLAVRLLLLATHIVAGKSYDGGLDADVEKAVKTLQGELLLEPVILTRERA